MTGDERRAWLSITPEPESDLPAAIATLRAGAKPPEGAIRSERDRVERLIVRARRRAYQRWLAEARALAAAAPDPRDPEVEAAARVARDVIENHDALARGLEPRRGGGRGG